MDLYRFSSPTTTPAPILVDVPHAGEFEPDAIARDCVAPYARRKRDFDLYVDRFWADAPSHGACLMVATHNRYVLDLNRSPDDVDAGAVASHPNPPGRFRRGLFWQVTAAGESVIDKPMSSAAYRERVARFHSPYHAKLQATLDELHARFGYVVLIDGHSMPSVGRDDHPDPGVVRADIVPGTNQGKACPASLVELCVANFAGAGFSVKVDDPYKGGWITRHYGRPEQRVYALQIEVSRRVYMDEESFVIRDDGMAALRQACSSFVARLLDWHP